MAWRIVKQPNGKLARFSDIVDDFTIMDMTEEEAFEICHIYLGIEDSRRKVRAGLEDWKPWTVEIKGDGAERWEDSLCTIAIVHGDEVAEERRSIGVASTRAVKPPSAVRGEKVVKKSNARKNLEFVTMCALSNRAHLTGLVADKKSEIIIEDVINHLFEASALWAVKEYVAEREIAHRTRQAP